MDISLLHSRLTYMLVSVCLQYVPMKNGLCVSWEKLGLMSEVGLFAAGLLRASRAGVLSDFHR